MGLSAATGVLSIGTGAIGTTYSVTGLSFPPSVVILWCTGQPTAVVDTMSEIDMKSSFGVALSPTDRRCVFIQSDHGVGSAAADRAYRTDCAVGSLTTGGAVDGLADFQSFNSDGFTLVIDDAFATGLRVSWLALGGSDLTNMALGEIVEPLATGVANETSLAFQPDCVLFFSFGNLNAAPFIATDASMMIGAATGVSNQAVWAGMSNDGSGSAVANGYGYDGECIAIPSSTANSTDGRAAFNGFLSNGFSLNWLERSSTRRVAFLALKGASFRVGNFTTQTDTTTPMVQSGFGFSPSAALLVSACRAKDTQDTPSDHSALSIGAFTSTSSRNAQAFLEEDGPTTMDVGVAIEYDSVYARIDSAAAKAIVGLMDVQSVDSDGFTTIMDDADPSAAFVWYLAVGPAAAAKSRFPLLSIPRYYPTRRRYV